MPVSPAYAEHTYSVCGMSDSQFREPMVKPIQPSASVQTSESICYITAKSSEVPFPTSDIAGAYTGESCIIQEVSCPEQASGVLTTHLLGYASGNDGGWIDTEMDIVSPYPPASTFTYHLPDYISVKQVSTISISIKPLDESQSQPYLDNKTITFFLLDWMKDDWVEQPLHRTTNTGEYTLLIQGENAQRFYDPKTQTIQVQLSVPDNAYPQFKLPISIEGIW